MKWKPLLLLIFLASSLIFGSIPLTQSPPPTAPKNITFESNVIPNLTITERPLDKPESFRFSWLGNKLDLELFFNATYEKQGENITRLFSLRDFETDFNVTVNYVVNQTGSPVQFGWVIDNVEEAGDHVHNAWFKIEDTQPFDYEDIELEVIETPEGYNITRFNLPDNLVLSFEDLRHKGFILGSQNKTSIGLKGFGNKTRWDLDPITFSAPTITVIGGTQGSPLNFWDIWNASNSSGWGVAWNNNDTQFSFNCSLAFGNGTVAGTTYFNDNSVQITFGDIFAGHWGRIMERKAYAHLQFGVLQDATDKTTSEGVQFITLDNHITYLIYSATTIGETYLYSSSVDNPISSSCYITIADGRVWNCLFTRRIYINARTDVDYYNLIQQYTPIGISYPTGTWDKIHITDVEYVFFVRHVSTISNIYARRITTKTFSMSGFSEGETFNLTNPDFDAWTFNWGNNDGEVFRQYTFDLTVTYPNGTTINGTSTGARAVIQHFGNNSGIDYNATLNEDGSINTTVLSMGFYNQTGGNSLFDYNPFNLHIYNVTGYEEYNGNFTLNKKEDLTLSLTVAGGYAGFVFLFLGLVIGVVVGAVIVFGSKRR